MEFELVYVACVLCMNDIITLGLIEVGKVIPIYLVINFIYLLSIKKSIYIFIL